MSGCCADGLFGLVAFLAAIFFVLGTCIGSFLNVCIYRIPREMPVYRPSRSFCPECKQTIAWYHNIPLLSYLLLRGKCAYCGKHFTARYFLVEALVGVLFLLVFLKYACGACGAPLGLVGVDNGWLVPVYWLAMCGLVLGTFVDFEHLIIPDRVTLGGIAAGFILSPLVPAMHNQETWLAALIQAVVGAAVGWGILWTLGFVGKLVFRKEAMGFGDVKLVGAIGAFLGWRAVLFCLFVSSFFGAIVGISLVLAGRKEMGSRIPYGPYLALAAVIWILWGWNIWGAYINLMMPQQPIG
jgi:leader peptidase (prepilin peptidase)/N-methyltransferase